MKEVLFWVMKGLRRVEINVGKIDQEISAANWINSNSQWWTQPERQKPFEKESFHWFCYFDSSFHHDIFGRMGWQIPDRNDCLGCELQLIFRQRWMLTWSFHMHMGSRTVGWLDQSQSHWKTSSLRRWICVCFERCDYFMDDFWRCQWPSLKPPNLIKLEQFYLDSLLAQFYFLWERWIWASFFLW